MRLAFLANLIEEVVAVLVSGKGFLNPAHSQIDSHAMNISMLHFYTGSLT